MESVGLSMESVFVTGATGFIGKALIEQLLKENKKIYALVLPAEQEKLPQNKNLIHVVGNLMEEEVLLEELADCSFDTIYHLAWAGVSTTVKNDMELQLKNISMAFHVMKIAHEHQCKRVICTGSISEYAYEQEEVNGQQLPTPCDVYSATKASVHIYCEYLARLYGVGFNWILIPSIYGPGRLDNNLITYCIRSLLRGEKPSFTKLEQMWDYIYIDDLIQALILVGEHGKENTVYPVGTGEARRMSEYVTIIKNSINPNAELGIGEIPYKTDRIDNAIVDISKIKQDVGYVPRYTFEEGIQKTIDFMRETEKKDV